MTTNGPAAENLARHLESRHPAVAAVISDLRAAVSVRYAQGTLIYVDFRLRDCDAWNEMTASPPLETAADAIATVARELAGRRNNLILGLGKLAL